MPPLPSVAAPPQPAQSGLVGGSLSGARVNPGLLELPSLADPPPPAAAGTNGAGTAQVRISPSLSVPQRPARPAAPPSAAANRAGGTRVQLSATPTRPQDHILADPVVPPMSGQEGFDLDPNAAKPAIVSTPPPDQALVPNHTGSPPPAVNLGDLQESFPALQPQGPTITESTRNEGLEDYPGLKTYPGRARRNAAKADPAVTAVLTPDEWQAQHNIPVEVIKENPDLFGAASKAQDGFRTDGVGNTAPLPVTPEAQEKLDKAGLSRPVHRGPHPGWTTQVRAVIRIVKEVLNTERLTPDMPEYGQRANELLKQELAKLRTRMLGMRVVK